MKFPLTLLKLFFFVVTTLLFLNPLYATNPIAEGYEGIELTTNIRMSKSSGLLKDISLNIKKRFTRNTEILSPAQEIKNLSLISLVFSILSVVFIILFSISPWLLIGAFVFGYVAAAAGMSALRRIKAIEEKEPGNFRWNKGISKLGIVLGFITIGAWLIILTMLALQSIG